MFRTLVARTIDELLHRLPCPPRGVGALAAAAAVAATPFAGALPL